MNALKTIFASLGLVAALAVPAYATTPGCVGKMWNPLSDLDFNLMGGIKIGGSRMMESPTELGDPPDHQMSSGCFCENGLQTGVGFGMSFWMPSYINDMARQAGCLGFLGGVNVMDSFISESSGQEYSNHQARRDGVTNMQIHWAYADVTAVAGKQLFEKCNAVTGKMKISYMTEPDFIFQNDIYSAIMSPQVAILAAMPILSQMACGGEAMANTLGGWQDFGICAWKGFRLPMSGTAIAKDSAQVSNMDVTVKYLTRASMLGLNLKTLGPDAVCEPQISPFYHPFQHRYQWAYPGRAATRYNADVVRWGMFLKNGNTNSMVSLTQDTAALTSVSVTMPESSGVPTEGAGNAGDGSGMTAPTGNALGLAEAILDQMPKPLNYPTREAGYMQVWEARQCCLMVLTIQNILQKIIVNYVTGGSEFAQMVDKLYSYYHLANSVYQMMEDPVGGALSLIGDGLSSAMGSFAGGSGDVYVDP